VVPEEGDVVRGAAVRHEKAWRAMADKRETVSIEVPKEWAAAVKKFIADVDGARPEIRGGRAVDYAAFERAPVRLVA
jgi:hypothetical protein